MTSTNHFIFQQATLPIHKFVRPSTAEGGAIIDFYFLSNGKEPFRIQSYSERKCGHVERKYESLVLFRSLCAYPAGIYHLKVNNRNTITRCEICSKLTIKIPERRQWRRSGIFIVNFEHISHPVLVLLLLILNIELLAGYCMKNYIEEKEAEDWLKCQMCLSPVASRKVL